ncbi:MAG: DUF3592 domain-containing protein [Planctomycetota bacterium]
MFALLNRWRRLLLVVGWLFLAGSGPICMIIGAVSYFRTRSFIERASVTEGVVVEMVERRGESGTTFAPVFVFSDGQGESHTIYSRTSSYPPSHSVGDRVTVLYERDSPEDACLDEFFDLWAFAVIPGGIGLVHFIVGLGLVLSVSVAKRFAGGPPEGSARETV